MMIGHLLSLEGTSAWVIRPGLARVLATERVDLESATNNKQHTLAVLGHMLACLTLISLQLLVALLYLFDEFHCVFQTHASFMT